jgi:hypothetical protein
MALHTSSPLIHGSNNCRAWASALAVSALRMVCMREFSLKTIDRRFFG